MKNPDITGMAIERVAGLIEKGKVSPAEVVEAYLGRIEKLNPKLNAYMTVMAETARGEARAAEAEIRKKKYRGPLHGIPIALKDNIYMKGVRTTAGSKVLAEFVPDTDATVVERLRAAGAIVLGKTGMHEFAYGVTCDNPFYGSVRNPWDTTRIPGGSSGGSAAAIAAGMCAAALGSDTGGSIRIPAALCGVVGLKPTFGRVSCYGVIALCPSLDHTGPLARSVGDAAILLEAIAGVDARDYTTAGQPRLEKWKVEKETKGRVVRGDGRGKVKGKSKSAGGKKKGGAGIKLGWPKQYYFERVHDEVRAAVEAAAKVYESLGAEVIEVELPRLRDPDVPRSLIALPEARAYHERMGWWPARAADYSEESRKRLEAGGEVKAMDYVRAWEVKQEFLADFAAAFAQVDAILAPTVPAVAPPIGASSVRVGGVSAAHPAGDDENVRSALLRLNRPQNLTGLPAISVPCGFTRAGLPIGMQLIAAAWEEAELLRIARVYEQATEWSGKQPAL
jgi:aspartyl-tRNA(Asn)/glutamyl-tRNA(Gln) amidotransferase subunit A